jgi:hypothetical protein
VSIFSLVGVISGCMVILAILGISFNYELEQTQTLCVVKVLYVSMQLRAQLLL